MSVYRRVKRNAFKAAHTILIGEPDIADDKIILDRRGTFRLGQLQLFFQHALWSELFGDLFVLDPYVFLLLIPGQQLFPRASKVLVGVQNRDKGADCQVTLNDQITADGKEEEGGKLIDKVVEEFDTENGTYLLRPPETAITVQQLLTHTSGFGYAFTSSTLRDYQPEAEDVDVVGPLLFDPGTAWQYGTSTDWLGRLVERVSGQDLETYFREHIFAPLQMLNTGFNVPESSWVRIVTLAHRQPTGTLFQDVREDPSVVATYSGGGGLLSTADDYARFMRMWLSGGMLDGRRVLSAETIALMAENHIGDLAAGGWVSAQPDRSNDFKPTAEGRGRWGLGFLVNLDDEPDRRMAGSLAWAGLYNTYFWIDPSSDVAGVLLTQVLPFGDPQVLSVFEEFERATYSLAEVVR